MSSPADALFGLGTPARDEREAQVIVVGAGPAGAATAYHLANAGIDVLLLEKSSFPRDKVCGDGLTPRAVKQLIGMGFDLDEPGWQKNKGLRIIGAGHRIELPWPELASFPAYGMVRPRMQLDELLARHAQKAGARLLERTSVTGPVLDAAGRIVGVTAKPLDANGRRAGDDVTYRAQLVVACDGVSSRLATGLGITRRENRPMAVAARAYYKTPMHDDPWMESWLELWDGKPGESNQLPGYGWIFPCGDGTANVGLGILDSSAAFRTYDSKAAIRTWLAHTPEEMGFSDPSNLVGEVRSAALPMGFNRKPHYRNGLLLVGDAGGMVNPFNGEGIDYALEAGHMAAEVMVQALARPAGLQRERVLHGYQAALDQAYGGYFTLGRGFAKLIGNPKVMKLATRHGLPRPALMRFTLKLMANLTDHKGDAHDRIINALAKIAPDA
ncbi:geranylgeranyl reductase family protein [Nocardioides jiangxiensis]|uniref:Geranylgeranyl reductase family protein n=1 Tax=Nocardioides jiangxiensis TaxID=3064524 RepID=A0ABT9B315_9ACTN|nr:geranylgeranyl reductase family protein [Nocardioides sp. WY-20]MDO7868618.1 geranylgeranyl reductase family protein [Nocardioides sp. WY-20]